MRYREKYGRGAGTWYSAWGHAVTRRLVGIFAGVVSLAVAACPAPAAAAGRCGAHPWCDTSLSPAQRAHLMLAAMSQGDKLSALVGAAAGDVDLPSITWTDGPVGVTVNGPAT